MNTLDRAKAFLKGPGRRLALVVVPLATMAASAYGATIFSSGRAGFWSSGGTVNVTTPAQVANLPELNGITGIKTWGTATQTATDTSFGFLQFEAGGNLSAGPWGISTLPLSWAFDVTPSGGESFQWAFFVSVSGVSDPFTTHGHSLGATPFEGWGNIGLLPLADAGLSQWSVVLRVNWTPTAVGDTLTLNIPNSSLDVNGANGPTGVPEPASWLLLGPGLAFLLYRRSRKR